MRIVAAAVVVLAAAPAFAAVEGAGAWSEDLPKSLDRARREGKPVLVDFTAPWCGWCRKMEEETFPDPGVKALLDRYVLVRVDTEKQPALAKQYGVKGLPTFLILDAEGKVLRRVDGFRGAQVFSQELKRGLDGDTAPSDPLPKEQQGDAENPLPGMVKKMEKVRGRLESEETGKGTQKEQEELLAQLEEMIRQAEQQGGG